VVVDGAAASVLLLLQQVVLRLKRGRRAAVLLLRTAKRTVLVDVTPLLLTPLLIIMACLCGHNGCGWCKGCGCFDVGAFVM